MLLSTKMMRLSTIVAGLFWLTVGSASAETYENSWTDWGWICPDVGLNITGIVKVRVTYSPAPRGYKITSFVLTTTHPHGERPTASVSYLDTRGSQKSINLVAPWFSTITAPNNKELFLPRAGNAQGGPEKQLPLFVSQRQAIKIKANLRVKNTRCVTSFSESFRLE